MTAPVFDFPVTAVTGGGTIYEFKSETAYVRTVDRKSRDCEAVVWGSLVKRPKVIHVGQPVAFSPDHVVAHIQEGMALSYKAVKTFEATPSGAEQFPALLETADEGRELTVEVSAGCRVRFEATDKAVLLSTVMPDHRMYMLTQKGDELKEFTSNSSVTVINGVRYYGQEPAPVKPYDSKPSHAPSVPSGAYGDDEEFDAIDEDLMNQYIDEFLGDHLGLDLCNATIVVEQFGAGIMANVELIPIWKPLFPVNEDGTVMTWVNGELVHAMADYDLIVTVSEDSKARFCISVAPITQATSAEEEEEDEEDADADVA